GLVPRAVVRDHDLRLGERLAQRRKRPADPRGLVARRDEHRQARLRHPLLSAGGAGGGAGGIPSVASFPTPYLPGRAPARRKTRATCPATSSTPSTVARPR